MPSAGTSSTAMPSAGTSHATKSEPGVLPGSESQAECIDPSHYAASTNLPTGDATTTAATPEPDLSLAVTAGPDDISKLVYVRVSENALAHIGTFVEAAPRTHDPAGKSQIHGLQQVLRRFRETRATDDLVERTEFDAEVARHVRFRDQFDKLGGLAEEEARRADAEEQRADQSAELVIELRAVIARLLTSPPPAPDAAAAPTPRPNLIKIAEPAPYSGCRDGLKQFKNKLTLMLADQHRFADEQHRLRYCFQLLQGEALAIMEPFLRDDSHIAFETVKDFLKELTRVFGDSNEKATAARELERLRQGNRDFSRYYADFTRLVNVLGYNGEARRDALERSLSQELLDALRYEPEPDGESLPQFEPHVKRLDDRLRRCKVLSNSRNAAPIAARTADTATRVTVTGTGGGQSRPANANASGGQPLSAEERAQRLAQGLCFYCGEHGHMDRDCTSRPAAATRTADRPTRTRNLRAAATGAPASNSEDRITEPPDSDGTESGKGNA